MEGFFCLSGFLITKTLLRRLSHGWVGIKDFAVNRLRRLMPVLILFLFLVSGLNLFFKREGVEIVLKSILWSVLGFYNYFEVGQGRGLPFTSRIWSLSVEDQYYMMVILCAAIIVFFNIKKPLRLFLKMYFMFIALSLGARLCYTYCSESSLSHISYLTIPRLWGFALGGLTALACNPEIKNYNSISWVGKVNPLIWLCLAYLAMITVKRYEQHAFLLGWLFSPALIAAAIFAFNVKNAQNEMKRDAFLARCVAQIGVACYPIYLFQMFEKIMNLNFFWPLSFLFSVGLGLSIHFFFERKFYRFPVYFKF